MVGQLITLPLRLTARAGSLMLRGTEAVLTRVLALAGQPVSADPPAGTGDALPTDIAAPPPPQAEPAPPQAEIPAVEQSAATPEAPADVPPEPVHVSEEPELIREEADSGAADGAGAQVTVDEPWEGYARLKARDVIARLSGASQAELAAVTLYEGAHRARQTVLSAVERQLALTARGGTSN